MPRKTFNPAEWEPNRHHHHHHNHHGHFAPGHFPEHPHLRVHGMMPPPIVIRSVPPPVVIQEQRTRQPRGTDVIKDFTPKIKPVEHVTADRKPIEPAIPYKELVTSKVYFTNEKWQECLSSHGIDIDVANKQLTMKNDGLTYNLTDNELKALTANSLKTASVQDRLDIINNVIGAHYQEKVTMDMLNSRQQFNLNLKPEAAEAFKPQHQDNFKSEVETIKEDPRVAHVDGAMLNELDERKGWYREGKHGRDVDVQDIRVEPSEVEGKYKMTAVINGEEISHEITQKQYDKFVAVDDLHRMKLFSKIFHEVDMKNNPHQGGGFNLGAAILAGFSALGGLGQAFGRPIGQPDYYVEHHSHGHGHIYAKPGVDSPQDIACRAFEAGINAAEHGVGLSR